MKLLRALIATCGILCVISMEAFAQGSVVFVNRVTRVVDARVTFLDGTGVGAGFTAQLYGGPAGSSIEQLTPLFPVTTFRTTPAAALGYIFGVFVKVPDVPPGQWAVLVMRVFEGSVWESSTCRGESNPVTAQLSGSSTGVPPPPLVGLQPFSVDCVPEPATLALLGLAAGGWCLVRWLKRKTILRPANDLDLITAKAFRRRDGSKSVEWQHADDGGGQRWLPLDLPSRGAGCLGAGWT